MDALPCMGDAQDHASDLLVQLVDVHERDGEFLLWGLVAENQGNDRTIVIRVSDYCPSFYLVAPVCSCEDASAEGESRMERILRHFNALKGVNGAIAAIQECRRNPIMFYRKSDRGCKFLRVFVRPGAAVSKVAAAVSRALQDGQARQLGMAWHDTEAYEAEIKMHMQFMCDLGLSGASWILLLSGLRSAASPDTKQAGQQPFGAEEGPMAVAELPHVVRRVVAKSDANRASCCDLEMVVRCACIAPLSPDATQLLAAPRPPSSGSDAGGLGWQQPARRPLVSEGLEAAVDAAVAGAVASWRMMTLSVLCVPNGGADRTPDARHDPIIAITCLVHCHPHPSSAGGSACGGSAAATAHLLAPDGPSAAGCEAAERGGGGVGGGGWDRAAWALEGGERRGVTFTWGLGEDAVAGGSCDPQLAGVGVRAYASEPEMLEAWICWVRGLDPDGFVVFQVRDSFGLLVERARRLGLDGGQLLLGRTARGARRAAQDGVTVSSVVMYSPAWVKSQSRMASTSNQETFQAAIPGRIVFDVLRQVLSSFNLRTYTLPDAVSALLHEQLEVLPPPVLHAFWRSAQGSKAAETALGGSVEAAAAGLRLRRYAARQADVVTRMFEGLAMMTEAVEMSRMAGLTLTQVLYRAMMVRSWSLLIRSAHRRGFIIAGRLGQASLSASPFLMHPVELGHVGLYQAPVISLDFASLYPSLYQAHNLCYTTLLPPGEACGLSDGQIITTPSGSRFVRREVQPGLLPDILSALVAARKATRASMQAERDAVRRAVLEARQKALKMMANALYGFTGAQASPLQCVPLADSCLSLGAATCRRAKEIIEDCASAGQLGGHPTKAARVIYAQTDSLFVLLPGCCCDEAAAFGKRAAQLASAAFEAPIELKFERVLQPFMLLHVNRYAGREHAEGGAAAGAPAASLLVKGIRSCWRQSAPIVRNTLQEVLRRILMEQDIPSAVRLAESQIRRLLGGDVEPWELVMTAGLWRLSSAQLQSSAAEEGAGGGAGGGAAVADEVRGPHAALAVRMMRRDTGLKLLLGQRLPFVLLSGARMQDEAAEEPLAATASGRRPDYMLYWKNKLQPPLAEIFATCLPAAALKSLLHGPHTMVRPPLMPCPSQGAASHLPRSAPAGATSSQQRLNRFYTLKRTCAACRRPLPSAPPPGSHSDDAPAVCSSCRSEEGAVAAAYLELVQDCNRHTARLTEALAACAACHSGGAAGAVLCCNAECAAAHARLHAEQRLSHSAAVLRSLDVLDW